MHWVEGYKVDAAALEDAVAAAIDALDALDALDVLLVVGAIFADEVAGVLMVEVLSVKNKSSVFE